MAATWTKENTRVRADDPTLIEGMAAFLTGLRRASVPANMTVEVQSPWAVTLAVGAQGTVVAWVESLKAESEPVVTRLLERVNAD